MRTYVNDITFLSGNDSRYSTNDILVWKSDCSDFHSGSVVTVGESQEALFYLNGECMGTLGPGRHVMETDTIPWLSRLINWITRSKYIFHADIYYVNKVETPVNWGVGNITYEDPLGPCFSIGAHGEVTVTVTNARMLVEKLSGVEKLLTKEQLVDRFRGIIASEVMHSLVNMMIENGISVINVSAHLKTLSSSLQSVISNIFEGYGLTATQFRILGVRVPEDDDQYIRLKNLKANQSMMNSELLLEQQAELMRQRTDAEKMKIMAEAKAEEIRRMAEAQAYGRKVGGYSYQDEQKYEILKTAVENGGAGTGGIMSDMAYLGAGMGVMENFGEIMKNNMNRMPFHEEAAPNIQKHCAECGAVLSKNAKFCGECGRPVQNVEVKCPRCGYQTGESKFCPNCGYSMNEEK